MLSFHLMSDNVSATPLLYGHEAERWTATILESRLQILMHHFASQVGHVRHSCCKLSQLLYYVSKDNPAFKTQKTMPLVRKL